MHMFFIEQLNGLSLPEMFLCLTFDDGPGKTDGDGPGPKTDRLAKYLSEEGISATFFFVGRFMAEHLSIVQNVFQYGHTIGNHTYEHIDIGHAIGNKEDLIREIAMTDELIRPFVGNNPVFFRAPWGIWPAEAALLLNSQLDNGLDHIGPFHWDIQAGDWLYWLQGKCAEECAHEYLSRVIEVRRGILLFHDSTADFLTARNNNLTYETILILVPLLKKLGFQFVSLSRVVELAGYPV
jgi:peptidoglycan-N-acetylglucosamine deacetylase